jgi:glycosyltransferase involved in cell wall biosynthesis
MKIAYLSSSAIPSDEANGVHVVRMCSAMAGLGHEVMLFSRQAEHKVDNIFKYYGTRNSFGIATKPWPKIQGAGGLVYGLFVKAAVSRNDGVDLFLGRDIYSIFQLRNAGVPIIYESHQPPPNSVKYYMEKRLFRNRNFKKLVVISQKLKDIYLTAHSGLSEKSILVAHDAADAPGDLSPNLAKMPGGQYNVKIGYTGSFNSGRGIELILRIADAVPEAAFYLLGGKPSEIDKLRKTHQNGNIFLLGYKPPCEIAEYLSMFDILLAPYQQKVAVAGNRGDTSKWMSPLKIFEYMANGKAIICSDLPVVHEVLRHEHNCLLCHPEDVSGWIENVRRLIENNALKMKLGAQAKSQFLRQHTWEKRAEKIIQCGFDT